MMALCCPMFLAQSTPTTRGSLWHSSWIWAKVPSVEPSLTSTNS